MDSPIMDGVVKALTEQGIDPVKARVKTAELLTAKYPNLRAAEDDLNKRVSEEMKARNGQ